MKKCDLLIVTAPVTDTAYPLQAPAVIKSAVIKHGFTAHTYDINYNFFKEKDENHDFLKNSHNIYHQTLEKLIFYNHHQDNKLVSHISH